MEEKKNTMTFEDAEGNLEKLLKDARTKIIKKLQKENTKGLVIKSQGGQEQNNKNDRNLHFWIETKYYGVEYVINLFYNEIDTNSGNGYANVGRIMFTKDYVTNRKESISSNKIIKEYGNWYSDGKKTEFIFNSYKWINKVEYMNEVSASDFINEKWITVDDILKSDSSKTEELVKAFIEFVKSESKRKKLYIVKMLTVGFSSPHLLKLNRTTKHLEYYRLSTDNAILHDYYPIRKDFDSSDYLMYEKEKEFPCIWGGGDTPTPEGSFQIEKVSEAHEEYISGYYTGHDKVKFFGYLVVFEDYFIHSNLYTEEATQDTFEQMKHINGAEEHSSGCIRLTQEDLDWLVKNVEVGTTVVM